MIEKYEKNHTSENALWAHVDKVLKGGGLYYVEKDQNSFKLVYWYKHKWGDNKYKVLKGFGNRPFDLTFGTHTRNYNGYSVPVKKGDILIHDSDAPIGHVWFYYPKYLIAKKKWSYDDSRGYIDSGSVTNLIKSGHIQKVEE
ncbi:MAG TPA: hypothetical protein VEA58_07310 [Anaerovoracaceae bacterium]|nr:hypothetical protein [Anaerovoracaceae bacterium]